jgi:hypothetical protein
MEKLKQLSKTELADRYYNEFGLPADHQDKDTIIAALWFGKRIKYITQEEVETIKEY